MTNAKFKKNLNKAIDKALLTLGDSAKQSVVYHLEQTFNLESHNFSNDIKGFDCGLKTIFGQQGALLIEKLVISELEAFGYEIKLSDENFDFVLCVSKFI